MKTGYRLIIDRIVAHEIAHQWFYGIVGNDQIRYPFLDEGLCRFAEYLYEDAYPPEQPQPEFSYARGISLRTAAFKPKEIRR